MSSHNMDEVRREWVWSVVGGRKPAFRWGGSVHIEKRDEDLPGTYVYHRRRAERRTEGGPFELARYIAGSGVVLLNGDGLNDPAGTNEQAWLRREVQNRITGTDRVMLLPYAALTAAGIDFDTIKPIEITADRHDEVWHELPAPPSIESSQMRRIQPNATEAARLRRINQEILNERYEGTSKGHRWQVDRRRQPNYKYDYTTGRRTTEGISEWRMGGYMIFAQPENGNPGWQQVHRDISAPQFDAEGNLTHSVPMKYAWLERIHRLGAVVFSAEDESGKRRRYVSAFDQNEPTPMYYMAQLPNKGRVDGYQSALDLLMPEIVQEAMREGRDVYRQGDIFAIETKLTDEQVYGRSVARVRRAIVLQPQRVDTPLLPPADEEVHEKVPCPYCSCKGHVRGVGERARRTLMVHGTSHTATEVVVGKGGATYIRGTLHHDPQLEEAGRTPEHRDRQLGEDASKWFLCVRNTVPRRRRPLDARVQGGSHRRQDAVVTTPARRTRRDEQPATLAAAAA